MEPERRQVAVVFVDMVGFTPYAQKRGEEASFLLMRYLAALMSEAVQEHGGTTQGFTGDGVMAVFGAPVAFEDAPLRACRAALAILSRLDRSSADLEARFGERARVRIGMNFGLVIFGAVKGGETVLGDTVNFAARLQTLAEPDTIVMSRAMYLQLRGWIEASDLGEHDVKGRSGLERIYRLNAMLAGAARFDAALQRGLTAYVGRDRELETLERALEHVAHGLQAIDIVGEPGIGKSRLLHEFRAQCVKRSVTILSGACAADSQRAPFGAFFGVVRGWVRLVTGEEEASVTRKLEEGLAQLQLTSIENVGLLMNMLGLEPPKGAFSGLDGVLIGTRTRALLLQIVEARARLAPLIMIFEDLHWMDTASEDLLASLETLPAHLPLLILHTRRPGRTLPWASSKYVSQLFLEPLSSRETTRIAEALLGVERMPDALARLISSRAEGNALFAEEIVSYLREKGIVRHEEGRLAFDATSAAAALPESVQALLASRVDQLPAAQRALLQAASVVGRSFDPDLALALTPHSGLGRDAFAALEALDLVRQDARSGEYLFKHALVRDAIYGGLLKQTRIALHLLVAEQLELRNANRLYEIAETLALHFLAARSAHKAFVYLAMAGDKSLNVYAIPEAEQYYRQALSFFEADRSCAAAPSVVRVVVRLLEALLLKSDYRQAGQVAQTFMPFMKQAGETPDLVVAQHYHALSLVQSLQLRTAHDLMVESLAIAERLGDGRARAYARGGLLQCRTRLGLDTLEEAERMKSLLLDDALRFGDSFIQNASYYFVSWDYFYRGLFKQARAAAKRLIASGQERKDPRAIGVANWILAGFALVSGAPELAISYADECMQVAISPFDRMQASIARAVASIFLGQPAEGLAEIERLNSDFVRLGLLYSVLDGPRGAAMILLGRFEEGVRVIEKAIVEREAIGDQTSAAFARVPLAEIYIQVLSRKRPAPSLATIARNWRFLLSARLFGARRATTLLEKSAANAQFDAQGFIAARINYTLGELHVLRRRRVQARRHFQLARLGAEAQGETTMLTKIDAALSAIA